MIIYCMDVSFDVHVYGSAQHSAWHSQWCLANSMTCFRRCAGKKLHETFFSETSRREKQSIIARFAEECLTHSKLRHPNIVQLIGIYYTPGSRVPTLVMELMPLSLASALERYPDIPSHVKNVILLDVSLGLYFLHDRTPPIIHRDLTANNVLLSESMRAKIADLGVARIVNINRAQMSMHMTATPGTPCYMPPEAFIAKPLYDAKLDVFSMGNLIVHVSIQEWPIPLMEMFCPDPDHPGRLIAVTEVDRRADYLDRMGEGHPLTALATCCLQNDPRLRPTTSEIVQGVEDAIVNNPPPFPNTLEMLQRIKNLDGNVQNLEAQVTNLEDRNTNLEDRNTNLEGQVKNLEDRNTNLEAQVKNLETGSMNLEVQVKSLEVGNTNLEVQVKSLEAGNTNLEVQVKSLDVGNTNLAAQVKNLEAGNTNLEAQVKNLEADKKNLEAQMKNLEAEKNREISALQQENALLVKAAVTQKEPSTAVKATVTQKEPSTAMKAASTQKEPSTAVKVAATQKEPSTAVKAAVTQKEPSTAVKVAATQKEPSTAVKATVTQKEPSTAVKVAATQKEPSTAVKATVTQKEPSTAVKVAATQKEPSTAVKATVTQKESSTAVKTASTQKEPSTAMKAATTQKEPSTAVKAAPTQKEPSTAVEQKDIAAEEGDQVIIIVDVLLYKLGMLTCGWPTSRSTIDFPLCHWWHGSDF